MTNWQPRLDREAALRAAEARLVENPASIPLQFERACLLTFLGRTEEAKQAYLQILTVDSIHSDTLNNLGALLNNTGYRSAARTVYKQAVTHYPNDPAAHVNLANILLEENDLAGARAHYEAALLIDTDLPLAHQGMTRIFSALRDEVGASRHRERGFSNQPAVTLPYQGTAAPLQLLLLVAADGGNIPVRQHIDDHIFMTTVIFADFYDAKKQIPPHHLVFNTIGDADLCMPALKAAVNLLKTTSAPILNPPEKIIPTSRAENAQQLSGLTGVRTAKTLLLPKEKIAQQEDLNFPLLLRAPGFHTGQHFVKVDKPEQLATAIAQLPGIELLVMEYLNASGADGLARKYRVMMIGGKLYPLHLAISHDWKVHYFTAAMADQPGHQAEEKKFLEDMPTVIGARGMAGLECIKDKLGLDYGGVDFGLDAEGNILLFEANATMVINPPALEEQWAYRHTAIDKALQAVKEMLLLRAHSANGILQGNVL